MSAVLDRRSLYRPKLDDRARTRLLSALVAALLVAGVVASSVVEPSVKEALVKGPLAASDDDPRTRGASVYRGLGAWIDAFDYGPAYHRPAEGPLLGPESVDSLAERGVRTLYLQATRLDSRSPEGIVDSQLVGRFLERAHQRGVQVVGWYLPKFGDLEADLANLRLIRDFKFEGHRFDGIGVDIEWRRDVRDHAERNRRLVELSRRLREETKKVSVAAIVYPPVLLESVYPAFWPDFPWSELAGVYDAWLPMTYWTETTARSGYRDGYRYTVESVKLLRARLGDQSAPVHAVGGVAGDSRGEDLEGFTQAVDEAGASGLSLYDYRTTSALGWDVLQRAAPAK